MASAVFSAQKDRAISQHITYITVKKPRQLGNKLCLLGTGLGLDDRRVVLSGDKEGAKVGPRRKSASN